MRKQYVSLHDIHVDLRHMTAYEAIKRIHELAGDELLKEYSDDTLRARLTLTEQALEAAGALIEAYESMKEYENFARYQQAYRDAVARLEEVAK